MGTLILSTIKEELAGAPESRLPVICQGILRVPGSKNFCWNVCVCHGASGGGRVGRVVGRCTLRISWPLGQDVTGEGPP